MKRICLFLLFLIFHQICSAQLFQTTSGGVGFYSSAPLEDIKAVSREGTGVLDASTGEISFKVKIRSFNFRKGLMQEHFNENYMESHKYPDAIFRGKITEPLDTSSSKEQRVNLKGILTVHGVERERELPAVIQLKGNSLQLKSKFDVACKDHDIKIPRLMFRNIAEVIEVTVNTNFKKSDQ